MGDENAIILKGRVAGGVFLNDANGTSVINFILVTNRIYKKKNGEKVDEATYVPIEAWGVVAEDAHKVLENKKTVLINGRLKQDRWKDKEGNDRSKLKVVIENFKVIDRVYHEGE
jgi:single-strand DNA-binding protein